MSPYERGLVRSPRKTDAILEKALGSRFHDTPEGPGWEPPVRHLGDFSRVKLLQEWKRFQAFLTPYLQGNALLPPRILRQIYSVRKTTTSCSIKKRSAINAQEIFNRAGRKHIHGCDSLKEKCTVQLVWTQKKSAERLANPHSIYNFRLDLIRSHESSIPHVQVTKLQSWESC